jgi:hypothetical protein
MQSASTDVVVDGRRSARSQSDCARTAAALVARIGLSAHSRYVVDGGRGPFLSPPNSSAFVPADEDDPEVTRVIGVVDAQRTAELSAALAHASAAEGALAAERKHLAEARAAVEAATAAAEAARKETAPLMREREVMRAELDRHSAHLRERDQAIAQWRTERDRISEALLKARALADGLSAELKTQTNENVALQKKLTAALHLHANSAVQTGRIAPPPSPSPTRSDDKFPSDIRSPP